MRGPSPFPRRASRPGVISRDRPPRASNAPRIERPAHRTAPCWVRAAGYGTCRWRNPTRRRENRTRRWRKLWMTWWKSASSGGQHRHRCGYLVDSQKNFKSPPANPCATGVPGSRNTSLPETGTTPGATPERRKNRETGTSRGHPVPADGRLTKTPAGQPAGQRPKTGPGPCISYMQGPGLFQPTGRAGGPRHSLAVKVWPESAPSKTGEILTANSIPGLASTGPGPFPGAAGRLCAVGHAAATSASCSSFDR
jgi:hypothetical protein